MKAILLAAGKGSRISKSIPPIPKSALKINDEPIILRTIHMLKKYNIKCAIVVGYQHEYIRNIMINEDVEIYYNPFYDITNSIGSLYFAKEFIDNDDLIIANADVFWTIGILELIIEANKNVVMLSDKRRVKDGDYFFSTENGIIKKYGKNLSEDIRDCEYVGIAKIDRDFIKIFKNRLIEMVSDQQHGLWWEDVLYSMIKEEKIYTIDVGDKFWAEVDFIEDYYRIIEYAKKDIKHEKN